MGLFRALLSREHHSVRYLSASSYWMYLTHLTLVIALQAWVRTWDVPAVFKFAFIVATTCLILLPAGFGLGWSGEQVALDGRLHRGGHRLDRPSAGDPDDEPIAGRGSTCSAARRDRGIVVKA